MAGGLLASDTKRYGSKSENPGLLASAPLSRHTQDDVPGEGAHLQGW